MRREKEDESVHSYENSSGHTFLSLSLSLENDHPSHFHENVGKKKYIYSSLACPPETGAVREEKSTHSLTRE